MTTSDKPKPPSLLKWVGIPVALAVIFMAILYLAIAKEPDYMPAQQKKAAGVDVHAKHANSASSPTEEHQATENEHASHSATEHAEAIANEEEHANQASHADASNSHGH